MYVYKMDVYIYICIYIYKQHPSGDHRLMLRVGDSNAIQKRSCCCPLGNPPIQMQKMVNMISRLWLAERGPRFCGPSHNLL